MSRQCISTSIAAIPTKQQLCVASFDRPQTAPMEGLPAAVAVTPSTKTNDN